MNIADFVRSVDGFEEMNHAERIRLFAWFCHVHRNQEAFTAADIKTCFDELHVAGPSSIAPFLTSMVEKKPPDILKTKGEFRLERRVREKYDTTIGQRPSMLAVDALLSSLPQAIPDIVEGAYLDEALKCLRVSAFRAAIVMTWNMAYDHFIRWLFAKQLVVFNTQLPKSFPKAEVTSISKVDDFSDLKESQVLQVARSASIISPSLHKVMKEKLDRRNIAAHPSGVATSQLTAEEYIKDLVENVVLAVV